MKLTQEMIDAFDHALLREGLPVLDAVRAVLKIIDPVPEDVDTIEDRDGDEWVRSTRDPLVWMREGGYTLYRAYQSLSAEFGPITWEGK